MYLLEKTGVASVPGDAFFREDRGAGLVRFCYAKSDRDLDEACNRLERLKSVSSLKRLPKTASEKMTVANLLERIRSKASARRNHRSGLCRIAAGCRVCQVRFLHDGF